MLFIDTDISLNYGSPQIDTERYKELLRFSLTRSSAHTRIQSSWWSSLEDSFTKKCFRDEFLEGFPQAFFPVTTKSYIGKNEHNIKVPSALRGAVIAST